MAAKRRILAILAAAALGIALWFLAPPHGDGPAPATVEPAAAETAVAPAAAAHPAPSANAPTTAPVVAEGAHGPQRTEVRTDGRRRATLRGRCVDGQGTPLADCRVRLHGWQANRARMDAWLKDHADQPQWQDPPAVATGADGVFAFDFWPPPPFQFTVDVARDGCGGMSGRWSTLAEGSTTDVGDVALLPGVRVAGRVLDESGRPQGKERITLQRRADADARTKGLAPTWGTQVVSAPDGTFAVREWLAPGDYDLSAQDAELQSPKTVALAADRPELALDVVVRKLPPAATIAGRVLDEAGAPAADVAIEDRTADGWTTTTSARDGTFLLHKRPPFADQFARLAVVAAEYEAADDAPREVAWGAQEVEVRVRRTPALTLRVTDDAGAPVAAYLVRMIPQNRNRQSSADATARATGRHADGTVVIPGLTRGGWLLLVEFPADSGFATLIVPFTHEVGPRRLDLRAERTRRRRLRALDADDRPVAGSKVQLCELFGQPLTDDRQALPHEQWLWNAGGNNPLVLQEGVTDADGRLELQGPGGRDLGLCVLGPGHVPLRLSPVRLDAEDELVVRASRGARLVGRIVPAEALAELKRLARAGEDGAFPAGRQPTLSFHDDRRQVFPKGHIDPTASTGLRIADDGTFDVAGVPPGAWRVRVKAWITNEQVASSQGFDADRVELVDGGTTRAELDLSAVLPGSLQGQALCNGQPLANGTFVLQGASRGITVSTDAAGRFTASVFPGEYRALLNRQRGPDGWSRIAHAAPIRIDRGQTTSAAIVFDSGTLRVTVRDAAGKTVAGIRIFVGGGNRSWTSLPPTDASGVAESELTAEPVTLRMLPKALASPEAQQKLRAEAAATGNQDPLAPHWIALQTVALVAGGSAAVEVQLPASAGY
jgi:protocatechuate 3,4-dioxygenase beta subunit